MFSKTGNTVDSAVNQELHQGGVVNPGLVNQGVPHQGGLINQGIPHQGGLIDQALHHHQGGLANPGLVNQGIPHQGGLINQGIPHQGGLIDQALHHHQGGLANPGLVNQGIPHQGGLINQGLHHQGGLANPGFVNQGALNPSMTQDQTLGHTSLGTVSGMVGQGVSTGLGYHTDPILPTRAVDPQVHGHHGAAGINHGKGQIVFRPIEARFNHDKDLLGKMDPYCKFKIGIHKGKSSVAKGQGVAPVWNDSVVVKHKNQEFAKLKVKDHDKLRLDDTIGIAKIPLDQVISLGRLDTWIPVSKKDAVTGEVHLIIEYTPRTGKHGATTV